jgi:V8-like Glu-specific endopeptidase
MFKKMTFLMAALFFLTGAQTPQNPVVHLNTNIKSESAENLKVSETALKTNKSRNKVRNAAVSVVTQYGSGSGTYFKIGDYHIVITAYHVVEGEQVVIVQGRNNEFVMAQPIIKSVKGDIAVLLVPKLASCEPLKLKSLPNKLKNNIDKLVGTVVTYTGFPAHHELLTVDGKIANIENDFIIMHSYAWPGSSGSGVFDSKGRFIGVVSAVDIGRWHPNIPPAIVEDIVWVSPGWDISPKEIELYLHNRGFRK